MNWLIDVELMLKYNYEFKFNRDNRLSKSFLCLLDKQLRKNFESKTHFKINDKKYTLKPESDVTVNSENTSSFKALLIIDYFGQMVTINWKCLSGNKVILPSHEVTENDVEFWWEFEEEQQLIQTLYEFNTPIKLPFSVDSFKFMIRCYKLSEANLFFKLQLSSLIENKVLVKNIIDEIVQKWNEVNIDRHQIYNWEIKEEYTQLKEYTVFFELGYAGMLGIEFILKRLNESNLDIEEIVIDNIKYL